MDHLLRFRACLTPIFAGALLVAALSRFTAAEEAPSPQNPVQPRPIAAERCLNCHVARPGQADLFVTRDGFCQPIPAETWHRHDKHHDALYMLLSRENLPLTERILGFPLSDVLRYELDAAAEYGSRVKNAALLANSDPAKLQAVRQCLACHAPVEQPAEAGGAALAAVESGVSCQACHGNGLQYEIPHQFPVWRVVDAEVKSYRYGLEDLRNPWVRSRLCASCHVGAPATRGRPARFVRHEWYANRHPPLPSVEPATFLSQEPPHWQRFQEKLQPGPSRPPGFQYLASSPAEAEVPGILLTELKPSLRASFLAANANSLPEDLARAADAASARDLMSADMARTKDVLIGSLATTSAYAALLAADDPEMELDFALFDCQACHHELRSQFPSAARIRRQTVAGRPPPAAWPTVLSRPAVRSVSQRDEASRANFESALAALDAAFSARPFGDLSARRSAAERLAAACDQMGRSLARTNVDEAAARQVLAELSQPGQDFYRDYHCARQAAWGMQQIMFDLSGTPYRDGGEALRERVPRDMLLALGAEDEPLDSVEAGQRITELFGGGPWLGPLRLKLPAGREHSVIEQLPAWLKAIGQYDPAAFETDLAPIHAAFPKPN